MGERWAHRAHQGGTPSYDSSGRLSAITHPDGTISRTYDATTGKLATLSGPDGVTLSYTYDGQLMTGVTYSGAVTGSVKWAFDSAFRLTTETINNAVPQTFAYDNDDLLVQAGVLALTRDPESGRVTHAQAGTVAEDWTYNLYGEVESYAAVANGTPLLAFVYERDDLGRITKKTETSDAGITSVFEYQYDDAGRLTAVLEDGALAESYAYDANGNRTSSLNADGVFNATFDVQDRIESYGTLVFSHTANGEVSNQTDLATGDSTDYFYDALGNLKEVNLPNGDVIEYRVDGQGRRVAKLVNGVVTRQWIWKSQLQIAAELDGSGNVLACFVYAEGVNVPELMITPSATYHLVKDHLGSVRFVVDQASGAVVQELVYDAWGRVLLDTSPGLQPFGFAGGMYEAGTRLVRFGKREYAPTVGRWEQREPRPLSDGPNGQVYCWGDPINHVDRDGRRPMMGTPATNLRGAFDAAVDWLSDAFFGDDEDSSSTSAEDDDDDSGNEGRADYRTPPSPPPPPGPNWFNRQCGFTKNQVACRQCCVVLCQDYLKAPDPFACIYDCVAGVPCSAKPPGQCRVP